MHIEFISFLFFTQIFLEDQLLPCSFALLSAAANKASRDDCTSLDRLLVIPNPPAVLLPNRFPPPEFELDSLLLADCS